VATTANTITDAAYYKIGIRAPTGVEDAHALETLNNMVGLWGIEFISPSVAEENHTLTIGTASYTIGSGGAIDKDRPINIVNAFIRDATTSDDVPLKMMSAKEYNGITDKDESDTPTGLYYCATYPMGTIYLNKAPNAIDTLYLEYWKSFTEFALLTTAVNLPPEYKKTLIYNLTIELAEDNHITLAPSVYRTADLSRILISRAVGASRQPSGTEYPTDMGGILIIPSPRQTTGR